MTSCIQSEYRCGMLLCSETVIPSLDRCEVEKKEKQEESGSRCNPSLHAPNDLGPTSFPLLPPSDAIH